MWAVYTDKLQTSSIFLHQMSEVSSSALALFAGPSNVQQHGSQQRLCLQKNWMQFATDQAGIDAVNRMRGAIDRVLDVQLHSPNADADSAAAPLAEAVSALVQGERAGFQHGRSRGAGPRSERSAESEEVGSGDNGDVS
jgi:hypothetical protein